MQAFARMWAHPMVRAFVALAGLALCALGVTRLALRQRMPPDRCPSGMLASQERCCGVGQTAEHGSCDGNAKSCSSAQERSRDGHCVARFGVVSLAGGELFIGAADWDGASGGERFPRTRIAPFRIDTAEVTRERYRACASCAVEPGAPGGPVTNVTPEQAELFCRSQGGRLPSAAQWVFAASGTAARRYPWGNSGLVCRRAAFGLEHGPCAKLGGPELSGSRPDGASPEGLQDLAGNVAEWTREADGGFAARGGSFRSRAAAELKTWSALPNQGKAPYIGFRCAYPL
jgi:formylglycine-generating enzyme required for sulfatase activity